MLRFVHIKRTGAQPMGFESSEVNLPHVEDPPLDPWQLSHQRSRELHAAFCRALERLSSTSQLSIHRPRWLA